MYVDVVHWSVFPKKHKFSALPIYEALSLSLFSMIVWPNIATDTQPYSRNKKFLMVEPNSNTSLIGKDGKIHIAIVVKCGTKSHLLVNYSPWVHTRVTLFPLFHIVSKNLAAYT